MGGQLKSGGKNPDWSRLSRTEPFIEAKEIVGGYMVVAAESYEARGSRWAAEGPWIDDAGIEHRDS